MSRTTINPPVASPEAGQCLVADRAGAGGEIVHADPVTEKSDEATALDGMIRHVGDIDCEHVHRHATGEWTSLSANHGLAAGPIVSRACGAKETIGIADRNDGDACTSPCRPRGAVA